MKQLLVRKTFKRTFVTTYQKLNLKQDIQNIKNLSTMKNTKMVHNYQQLSLEEEQNLVWKILGQYQSYKVNTKQCLLCLNENCKLLLKEGTIC